MKTFEELFLELSNKVQAGDTTSGTASAISQGIHNVGKKVVEDELYDLGARGVIVTDIHACRI